MLRQILPNTPAPPLVAATLNTANAILLESYISFLGYGIQPPVANWGNMLTNAQSDFQVDAWLAVFPSLAITLAFASFNFIGGGLRDALDRRVRERQRHRIILSGDTPDPYAPPQGCRFLPRCGLASDFCGRIDPAMQLQGAGHIAACHHAAEVAAPRRINRSAAYTPPPGAG